MFCWFLWDVETELYVNMTNYILDVPKSLPSQFTRNDVLIEIFQLFKHSLNNLIPKSKQICLEIFSRLSKFLSGIRRWGMRIQFQEILAIGTVIWWRIHVWSESSRIGHEGRTKHVRSSQWGIYWLWVLDIDLFHTNLLDWLRWLMVTRFTNKTYKQSLENFFAIHQISYRVRAPWKTINIQLINEPQKLRFQLDTWSLEVHFFS